jgi:hypothetical protein
MNEHDTNPPDRGHSPTEKLIQLRRKAEAGMIRARRNGDDEEYRKWARLKDRIRRTRRLIEQDDVSVKTVLTSLR